MGPTVTRQVSGPLAVLSLDNQLYFVKSLVICISKNWTYLVSSHSVLNWVKFKITQPFNFFCFLLHFGFWPEYTIFMFILVIWLLSSVGACSELRCLRQHCGSFEPFCELKLAFVETKYQQKVRIEGITNRSHIAFMTARVKYKLLLSSFVS